MCEGLFTPRQSKCESENDQRKFGKDQRKNFRTSKKFFVFVFDFTQCEWALNQALIKEHPPPLLPRLPIP